MQKTPLTTASTEKTKRGKKMSKRVQDMTTEEKEALSYRIVDVVGQEWCNENAASIAEQLQEENATPQEMVYAGILAGLMIGYNYAANIE